MIRYAMRMMAIAGAAALITPMVMAQDAAQNTGNPAEVAPEAAPAATMPVMAPAASDTAAPVAQPGANEVTPVAPQTPAVAPLVNVGAAGFFPALPPSRPCEPQDVVGLWALQQVFENPIGQQMESFSAQPYQHLLLNRDSSYIDYRSAYNDNARDLDEKMIEQEQSGVEQFVLNNGFLYLYKNGTAFDTEACFIVANRSDPFTVGEMLLMPPADQAHTGRLVRVFQKENRRGNGNGKRKKKGKRNRNNDNG